MLIQPRLFASPMYIPITPVSLLPQEVKRLRSKEYQQRYRERKKLGDLKLKDLQLPLIWHNPDVEVEDRSIVEDLEVSAGPDAVGVGPAIDDPIEWTNEEIASLALVLIEESLRSLAAKGNPTEKLEILEWMFEPDIVESIVVQTPYGPRKKMLYADQVAFTFAFCCRVTGYDPDTYREFVRSSPEVKKRIEYLNGKEDLSVDEMRLIKLYS